jgi:hypothetical protein
VLVFVVAHLLLRGLACAFAWRKSYPRAGRGAILARKSGCMAFHVPNDCLCDCHGISTYIPKDIDQLCICCLLQCKPGI